MRATAGSPAAATSTRPAPSAAAVKDAARVRPLTATARPKPALGVSVMAPVRLATAYQASARAASTARSSLEPVALGARKLPPRRDAPSTCISNASTPAGTATATAPVPAVSTHSG